MANHGYISAKANFKKDQLLLDLQEINERRFKGLLKIEESEYGKDGAWFISYQPKDVSYSEGFHIWVRSARKLEHRHNIRGFVWYMELVFTEELGAKYNAVMSDDGFPETWRPDPFKYSSFKKYVESRYGHVKKSNPITYKFFVNLDTKLLPKEFKGC